MNNYYGIKAKNVADWINILNKKYKLNYDGSDNWQTYINCQAFKNFESLIPKDTQDLIESFENLDEDISIFLFFYKKKKVSNIKVFRLNKLLKTNFQTHEEIFNYLVNKYEFIKKGINYPWFTNFSMYYYINTRYLYSKLGLNNLKLISDSERFEHEEDCFFIRHHKPTDEYLRFNGWYSSYDGFLLQKVELVKPIQKIITVYETV